MASPIQNSPIEVNTASLSKMKVADLKKELKARGLNTVGTKNELIERLQASQTSQDILSEDGNAESEILDEDDVLGEEEEEGGDFDDDELAAEAEAELADDIKEQPSASAVAPQPAVKRSAPITTETHQQPQPKVKRTLIRPPSVSSAEKENGSVKAEVEKAGENANNSEQNGKKILKLSGLSVKERLELRAQKFGVPLPPAAKKEARAERFGLSSTDTPPSNSTKTSTTPLAEKLKKRAERFGMNVSKIAIKVEADEKLKKRQERFATGTAEGTATVTTATIPTTLSLADRKKLRADRFK